METKNPGILHAREMLIALDKQQNEIVAKLQMDLSAAELLSADDKKMLSMLLDTVAYSAGNSYRVLLEAQKKVRHLTQPVLDEAVKRSGRI